MHIVQNIGRRNFSGFGGCGQFAKVFYLPNISTNGIISYAQEQSPKFCPQKLFQV